MAQLSSIKSLPTPEFSIHVSKVAFDGAFTTSPGNDRFPTTLPAIGATSSALEGYELMTTYYVSSEIGSDNNAGTSAAAPFETLQVAANHTAPGDTVLVMNGTYTGGDPVLNITTGGTASAPITFAAAPGQTPVIDSSANGMLSMSEHHISLLRLHCSG